MPMSNNPTNVEVTEATVARIDERTKSIQTEIVQIRLDLKETIDSLDKRYDARISDIVDRHDELVAKLDQDYVKKSDFALIQKIVYGFVAIIVVAVVGAMIATVIVAPKSEARRADPTVQIQKELGR